MFAFIFAQCVFNRAHAYSSEYDGSMVGAF